MSTLNVDTLQDKAGAFEHARLVQVVNTQTGAAATGTTTIPDDDTIPQKTEGDEYMTLAITPTHASNILQITFETFLATGDSSSTITACLFQDTTANALATASIFRTISDGMDQLNGTHRMVAGTTSSTTFKVRAGCRDSGTTTFNGASGSRTYGGTLASSITISEIRV